jgi:transcription antitermination factor NusG
LRIGCITWIIPPDAGTPPRCPINRAQHRVSIKLSSNGGALDTDPDVTKTVIANRTACQSSTQWFAVYTSPCREKRVSSHLAARNVEHFLPLTRTPRRWKNGLKVTLEQPLFAGYLFVKIDRADRIRVLQLPGVQSLVGAGRHPIPLSTQEIETLRLGVELHNAEPCSYINVGQKARICSGPLQGTIGIITRRKGRLRFVLNVDLIMKSISLEIDESQLQLVG